MPIDFSAAGDAHPYPARGWRWLPWLWFWLICCVTGAATGILLQVAGAVTGDALFWWRALGTPNAVFLVILGVARLTFELQWWRAHRWNARRQAWIDGRIQDAQRPLQVLGIGYCLPLRGHQSLVAALCAGKPLFEARAPRTGSGLVAHNRFDDEAVSEIELEAESYDEFDPDVEPQADTEAVSTVILKLVETLRPLSKALHALSQYGPHYAPVVRVLARPEMAGTRLSQVREALCRAGLAEMECEARSADASLAEVDFWLDQGEWRPLLVISAEWYDANPPAQGTEGCVAVLLDPGCFHLPESVKVAGVLHRPVIGSANALGEVLSNAALWGRAEVSSIKRAWLTGVDSQVESVLLAAFDEASLSHLAKPHAQCRPDRILGDAATLNPWLAVAAAIEAAESGVHLIVDRAQAAVLHVNKVANDPFEQ